MAKAKAKTIEDVIVEDAIIIEQVSVEVVLSEAPVERQDPGHSSRDFRGNL